MPSAGLGRAGLAAVLLLAVAFAAMRAAGMLGPASLRALLPLGFCLMMATPWLLLDRAGRLEIGLRRSASARIYPLAIGAGTLAATLCFGLGVALFGAGQDNWFASVAANYRGIMPTAGWSELQLHLAFTLPALLFSPIGEEIFFRGVLQRALERRWSARASTVAECGLFAVVHLCHHGLVASAAGITLLPLSGAIWMVLMFGAALLFAALRKASGSLYPAMAAHAAFNLAMNVLIFHFLW